MTSPFDALLAAAQAAKDEGVRLQAAADGLQTSLTAAAAQHTADQATIADLQAQLDNNQPILWGASAGAMPGESRTKALARVQAALHPQILRYFSPAAPDWPAWAGSLPLALSFRWAPSYVLAGRADTAAAAFFAATPRNTVWSYSHEPEDNIERGEFTAADYQAAWRRLAGIAKASGKPLTAALILMGATARGDKGRNWRTYYPGPDIIDVLAWDCYAWTASDTPDAVYGPAMAASQAAGKPWAVTETGVGAAAVPDPATRQAMLTGMARWLATCTPRPRFVCYFDSDPDTPPKRWRISTDPAATAAWKAGQTG